MNIIEAEDLIKGLPDSELFQEAQYPSGRIPQYLAVSEVQRRQDMRQRFQAQQQPQQTVKDQILQGGIGSTGMAPEMSSMPPMAPQMPQAPAGMGAPPSQPQMYRGGITRMSSGGITNGGIVRMQEGRTVPGGSNELTQLVSLRRAAMARGDLASASEIERRIAALSVPGGSTVSQSMPNPALAESPVGQPSSRPRLGSSATTSAVLFPGSPDASPGIPAAGAAMNAPRQQANAGAGPMGYLNSLLSPQDRPAEIQAAIDMNKGMIEEGLPPPVDLNQYIQSAQQRQQSARDEARQDAIASTLMNLGTGLFAGDPAAGMQRATQEAMATLREGRKEASAEGRAAEQLQLQAAQQNRQQILDTMKFKSEAVNAVANIISGEQSADRTTKMQAAQIVANYQMNSQKMSNELQVAGMGREDIKRKLESEARNRATELVLDSIKNRISVDPINPEDLARQVNALTRKLLDGTDSSSSSALSETPSGKPRFQIAEVRTGR